MSDGDKKPYTHQQTRTGGPGERGNPETEHRETARPDGPEPNELNIANRNREKRYGPTTHQDTRIDPDPLEELKEDESAS